MSNNDPQNYDPYIATLKTYESKILKIQTTLTSHKESINPNDYQTLMSDVKNLLTKIQSDIRNRESSSPPEPDYIGDT